MKIYINMNMEIVIVFDKQTSTEPTPAPKATPKASQSKLTRYDGNFVGTRPSKVREDRSPNSGTRSDKDKAHYSSCCGAAGRRALKTLGGKCKDCVTAKRDFADDIISTSGWL